MPIKVWVLRVIEKLPTPISSAIKKWRYERAAGRRKRKVNKYISKYGTTNIIELQEAIRHAGVRQGDVVFVHCSFDDLYTFSGSYVDLLKMLRSLVGSDGTLLMPAYSNNTFVKPPKIFDPQTELTHSGIINELFRRSSGTVRSVHPRHSICGFGPLAESLLSGHEKCIRADGPDSPFDRLRKLDHAWILTLGLPRCFMSLFHWIEDIEPDKLPFAVHEDMPVPCPVRMPDGKIIIVNDWLWRNDLINRNVSFTRMPQLLSPEAMNYWDYKGISLGLYRVKKTSEELIALRDRGIIHYTDK